MPLAQNYKDDVSLLKSEAALTNCVITKSGMQHGNDRNINVS
jgi:hypothetical protein